MITAPQPKHAFYAALASAAAGAFAFVGLWPVSCLLCVEVGLHWAWAWQKKVTA